MLFVGHDLDEVREITDSVTVLRDGRVHGTVVTRRGLGGRPRRDDHRPPPRAASSSSAPDVERRRRRVDVERPASARRPAGCRFEVRAGRGARRHRAARLRLRRAALPALRRAAVLRRRAAHRRTRPTTLAVDDARRGRSPPAWRCIPADRQRDGSVGSLTVAAQRDDAGARRLPAHGASSCAAIAAGPPSSATSTTCARTIPGAPTSRSAAATSRRRCWRSGCRRSRTLLLLHEPTQGVDVGAREQIFRMLSAAAEAGMSIIVRELGLRAARRDLRPRARARQRPHRARARQARTSSRTASPSRSTTASPSPSVE